MKEAPMPGKKSNNNSDNPRPAVDLAMPLIDIRQDAAEQDAEEKPELSRRKKVAQEKEEGNAGENMGVEEHALEKRNKDLNTFNLF